MYMNRNEVMEVINRSLDEGHFTDVQREHIDAQLAEVGINKLGEYAVEIIMNTYGVYLSDIMRDMEDGTMFWDDCNDWALHKDALDEEAAER